jgi:hypothetical protein
MVWKFVSMPPSVHVRHAHATRLLGHGLLGLLLGADEHDHAVSPADVDQHLVGLVQPGERLLEVDDVVAGPLTEDEAAHLWVPPPGLMTEVDPSLE